MASKHRDYLSSLRQHSQQFLLRVICTFPLQLHWNILAQISFGTIYSPDLGMLT